jgi:hypothetical protein
MIKATRRSASVLFPALLVPLLLASCATAYGREYGISSLGAAGALAAERRLIAVPSTLVVLQDQCVAKSYSSSVELAAARGEAESAQLLFYSGRSEARGAAFAASGLEGPGGARLEAEIGVVAYVPVRKPSLLGFHRPGYYPDPILPSGEFSLPARKNRALWYTVRVPPDAPPGLYEGSASVSCGDGSSLSLPVRLRVYDVELPRTSFLKTSVHFRLEGIRDERYYDQGKAAAAIEGLPELGLSYRFSDRVDLPLLSVFSGGGASADWGGFDEKAEYWMGRGITCFELKLPINWAMSPSDIEAGFGRMLEEINAHLVERGWADLFYFYFYDEPTTGDMPAMKARLDAIRKRAPAIRNVLTYGTTKAGERELLGRVGIWVPNLHQLDPAFARRRQALGEEVWAYACVGNVFRSYPDNFRIDWYGAAHRALGWWLFKNGAQGFLYWAVDLWRVNPWESAATFPWTNGDGALFYPAPDRVSAPYPSIRAHLMREAFEDFDLLTLLRRAYEGAAVPKEVAELLGAKGIISDSGSFTTDDGAYTRAHARLLELLEAARGH